jgi:hypothetical protein
MAAIMARKKAPQKKPSKPSKSGQSPSASSSPRGSGYFFGSLKKLLLAPLFLGKSTTSSKASQRASAESSGDDLWTSSSDPQSDHSIAWNQTDSFFHRPDVSFT